MAGTTFLGFILTVGIGISFLALLLKWLDPERQIVAQEEMRQVPQGVRAAESMAAAVPAFFARAHAGQTPSSMLTFDERLFAFLENHVKAEQAMVSEFVHLPSIDSLYREARPSFTMN